MTTFTLFRQYLALLRKRKVKVDELLAKSSISAHQLEDPNCRMTIQQHDELWNILLGALPEAKLALKNNDTLSPASFSSLMYLAMSHHQAIEALTTLLDYKNQGSVIKIQIEQTANKINLSFNPQLFELQHWQYFLLLAAQHILDVLSWLKNEAVAPITIQLPKGVNPLFAEFLESHKPQIKISEGPPMLVFGKDQLQFSLTGSHPQVRAMLELQTKNEIMQYQPSRNLCDEITVYLINCFQQQYDIKTLKTALTLESTAQHFFVTSRTLQRKIKQQRSRFSAILDEVRLQRYQSGLHQDLAGEGLAEFCGFSDIGSVQRFIQRYLKSSQ